MRIDLIPVGDNPPESLNVIIEVPVGGAPVKYEFDKESGALFVDRILHTPMRYPANYGFVPHTLSPDGDPLDFVVADGAAETDPAKRQKLYQQANEMQIDACNVINLATNPRVWAYGKATGVRVDLNGNLVMDQASLTR